MSEMINRVARAIVLARVRQASQGASEKEIDGAIEEMCGSVEFDYAVEAARDVLVVMREPTTDMESAFHDEIHEAASAKWRAMIDAALV